MYEILSRAGEREYRSGKRVGNILKRRTRRRASVSSAARIVRRGRARRTAWYRPHPRSAHPGRATTRLAARRARPRHPWNRPSPSSRMLPETARPAAPSGHRSAARKMSAPTANHTSRRPCRRRRSEAHRSDTDRPASCNARTPSGVGWPTARSEQTSDAAVHTLRKCSKLLGTLKSDYRQRRDGHHHPRHPGDQESWRPRKGAGGGTARALILLIPRSGEDECGPSRVGNAGRRHDARLACHAPDYRSHSLRTARSFTLSHHNSVRASARRYEERYEPVFIDNLPDKTPEEAFADLAAQRRGYLRQTHLTILGSGWEILDARCRAGTSTGRWMLAFVEKPLQ